MNLSRSKQLFQTAKNYLPGGVNSPVRAFGAVGGKPPFIHSAQGAYLTDVDQNQYIDYVCSWGPIILGHAHPTVTQAVSAAIQRGLSFGAPTAAEVELAEWICGTYNSIEKIRLVNSGTEATLSALRLARGWADRYKIVKFEGHYHGHVDALLVQAGSGPLTLGTPSSQGVTPHVVQDTLVAKFNDKASVTALFEAHPQDIAAIIVEPYAGNMGLVLPQPGFLEHLRTLCNHYGALLIFDEVMSGFRAGIQGVQSHTTVKPDLTTLGKIIGGGMPVGAYGGRADIMAKVAPDGPVYQAGTLSGNPVAMAAGLSTLQMLQQPGVYDTLFQRTQLLAEGFINLAQQYDIPLQVPYTTAWFGLFFTENTAIASLDDVLACSTEQFIQFFQGMLKEGVYFPPSAYESCFLSLAHTEDIIYLTLEKAEKVFKKMKV